MLSETNDNDNPNETITWKHADGNPNLLPDANDNANPNENITGKHANDVESHGNDAGVPPDLNAADDSSDDDDSNDDALHFKP